MNKNKNNEIEFFPSEQKKQLANDLVRIRSKNQTNGLTFFPSNFSEGIQQLLNDAENHFSKQVCTTWPTPKTIKENTQLLRISNQVALVVADNACLYDDFKRCHSRYDELSSSMLRESRRWYDFNLFQKQLICFLYKNIALIEKAYHEKKEIDINHLLATNHAKMQGKDIKPFDEALEPYLKKITDLVQRAQFPQAYFDQLKINLYRASQRLNYRYPPKSLEEALSVPNLLLKLLDGKFKLVEKELVERIDSLIQQKKNEINEEIFFLNKKNIDFLVETKSLAESTSYNNSFSWFTTSDQLTTKQSYSNSSSRARSGMNTKNGLVVGEALIIGGAVFSSLIGLGGLVFLGTKVCKKFSSSTTRYNCRRAEEEAKAGKRLLSRV